MTDSMVERVARAIWNVHSNSFDDGVYLQGDSMYQEMARAAIEAMREPTEAMVEFGEAVRGNHADYAGGNGTANVFRAMIDEALK